jgi:hypothetical protein
MSTIASAARLFGHFRLAETLRQLVLLNDLRIAKESDSSTSHKISDGGLGVSRPSPFWGTGGLRQGERNAFGGEAITAAQAFLLGC